MLKSVCIIARSAGDAIMYIYNNLENYYTSKKNDKSPVTIADFIAHDIIIKGLRHLVPTMPILSEENPISWEIRKNWQHYWLVDPLDGTKEFLKHNNEFTVNIALVEYGKPVLGVIYAPAMSTMYYAIEGKSYKEINNKIVQIRARIIHPPVVVISRSHDNNIDKINNFLLKLGAHKIIKIGSSLKFCLVAEGNVQFYPRFNPTNIWDTCAGHAIALAAGAYVNDWSGNTLNYLPNRSFINPNFLVSVL
ncbi:3'(2'),5'-bisphosphate nucleotidase CysQ [Candidatus Pantoea edessiphila]|uniref:3'(2'),5'-bisphosphate nucleotidase CysQ n=1 Tax=Candidatus Pantoea edessiphila TaxID=2044610 RepID=A0A2P5SW25_9GAMM|nr:3'(2'),5'-bisphosphate nucleotidase CysQ [Candidatus Pantoea edessiphila]PPI86522.1 3'(2'),5'-bisphosphate nucleotidase [Candidatus Pantoea edessiphila]